MDIKQFAQSIKQKYPQYNTIDDDVLGNMMVSKYPQYKAKITGFTPSVEDEIKSVSLEKSKLELDEKRKEAANIKTPYSITAPGASNKPSFDSFVSSQPMASGQDNVDIDKWAQTESAKIQSNPTMSIEDKNKYLESIAKTKSMYPAPSESDKKLKRERETTTQMIKSQMENYVKIPENEKGPITGILPGITSRLGMEWGSKARAYEAARLGLAASTKSATGDTGILTDPDRLYLADLLPAAGDSEFVARDKVLQMDSFMKAKYGVGVGEEILNKFVNIQSGAKDKSLPQIKTGFGPDKSSGAKDYLQQGTDLAKQAQKEKDPIKKAALLEKSRTLSGVGGDMNRETKVNPLVDAGAKAQKFLAESDTLPIAGSIASNVVAPVLPVINTAFGAGVGEEAKGLLRRGGKEAFLPSIEEREEQKGRSNKKIAEYVIADLLFKGAGKALPKIGRAFTPDKGVKWSKDIVDKVASQTDHFFSGDKLADAIEKYALDDEYAKGAVETMLPSLRGKILSSEDIIRKLPIWNSAYKSSGEVLDAPKKKVYDVLARTAREMMKKDTPELFKVYKQFAGTNAWKSAVNKIFSPTNIGSQIIRGGATAGAIGVGGYALDKLLKK